MDRKTQNITKYHVALCRAEAKAKMGFYAEEDMPLKWVYMQDSDPNILSKSYGMLSRMIGTTFL